VSQQPSSAPTGALLRYRTADDRIQVGLRRGERVQPVDASSIAELLQLPAPEMIDRLDGSPGQPVDLAEVELLAPVDGRMEVWAAGVTYRRSREARVVESEFAADVYERVYDAQRPELFFKAPAWRTRGPGARIAVRDDSEINVPEPELALVVNSGHRIVGYTICNDVSSRTIEGDNPLYLPQAKVYEASCALGPGIVLAAGIADARDLEMSMTIGRAGADLWSGTAHTSQLVRHPEDLVEFATRALAFPDGLVLSTGTSLVPDLPFTLQPGDTVRVSIEGLGVLVNEVATTSQLLSS
jgi:2-dehydro-3-deoxy-D-arabinonate dehydratase